MKKVVLRFIGSSVSVLIAFFGVNAKADSVYSTINVQTSSEPVSIRDMISGWEGDFQPGKYAYSDARIRFGVEIDGWAFEHELRRYDYFTFSKDTSRFYQALDQGESLPAADLELNAKSFVARGFRLAKHFDFKLNERDVYLRPALAIYRVSQFQFGRLTGSSAASDEQTGFLNLDYVFEEDKILDTPLSDVDRGLGWAIDIAAGYQIDDQWRLDLAINDALNQFQFDSAGFSRGCFNFGSSDVRCPTQNSGTGRSGQSNYSTSIAEHWQTQLSFEPWQLVLQHDYHDKYQRLGMIKHWSLASLFAAENTQQSSQLTQALGEFQLGWYSTNQLGLGWRNQWLQLHLIADDNQAAQARDVELNLGLNFSW